MPPLRAQVLLDKLDVYETRYRELKERKLELDMTRGKPSSAQLDLAAGFATILAEGDIRSADGVDIRNYGGLEGLPEMRSIFAEMLETEIESVLVGGNSSLTMMHDALVRAMLYGVPDGNGPWFGQQPKFLCPSPGYDRHFAICEHLGIELVTIPMQDDGPDVDAVEAAVVSDSTIKGMWCVPKYSNPTGATYSDAKVERLVAMETAASDFRLFWDNAYAVHDLYPEGDRLLGVLGAAARAGHPNRPLVFASTSKISWAGAGVAVMAGSTANIDDTKRHLAKQTIGPDKANQLRHVRFFGGFQGILAHMRKHAELLRPKFEVVYKVFARDLEPVGVARWTEPRGGYFISLDTLRGCASTVVRLAAEAGVKLTAAGATFPYGRDPNDTNIRIAPSLPPIDEVEAAMEVVSCCVLLASARQIAGAS